MPKKLSEIEKKKMIDSFINGITVDELSQKYNLTKLTITRHLKKGVNEKLFNRIVKKNNTRNSIELDVKDDLQGKDTKNLTSEEQLFDQSQLLTSSFIEIACPGNNLKTFL